MENHTRIISRQCRERRTDRISQILFDYKPDTVFIGQNRHAVAVIGDDSKAQISKMVADVGDSGFTETMHFSLIAYPSNRHATGLMGCHANRSRGGALTGRRGAHAPTCMGAHKKLSKQINSA